MDTKGVHVCSDATPTPTPLPPPPATEDCLCIFDIDRTLTGKQGDLTSPTCDKNKLENSIWDTAYGGGWLTLSEAAQTLPETFCNSCYLGVVSAGDAGGHTSPERPFLLENVLRSEKFDKMKDENSQACLVLQLTGSSLLLVILVDEVSLRAKGIVTSSCESAEVRPCP